jgi:phage terminase small subunit
MIAPVGRKLNDRQRLFALEYLACGNATEAYRRAGYRSKNPDVDGPALLGKPGIQAFLAPRLKKREERLELKAERLDEELARAAYLDPAQLFDGNGAFVRKVADLPENARRAIRSVKVRELFDGKGDDRVHIGDLVEVKLEPKVEAIGLAYRRLGLLKEKVEVDAGSKLADLLSAALGLPAAGAPDARTTPPATTPESSPHPAPPAKGGEP